MKRILTPIAVALSIVMTGCGGGGATTSPAGCTQTPEPPYPALLYPQANVTGVSTPSTTLVLAFTGDPSVYGSPIVEGSAIPVTETGLQPPPSPLPSPMASPPPGTTLMSVGLGSLQAKTTYRVWYMSNAVCVPPGSGALALHALGSFTTQ